MGESRRQLLARLQRFYGLLPTPPTAPFALFVWEVLSTHAPPSKRDAALSALRKIPALTPDAMRRAPQAKLEAAVGLAGAYAEQRLRALRAGVDLFRRTPGLGAMIRGPAPAALRALKRLPHLGESLSRCMMLFAGGYPVLPTDPGLLRVARRLGYGSRANGRSADKVVQRALRLELPRDVGALRHARVYLAHHASATCTERDPHCRVCPLLSDCPHGQQLRGPSGLP